MSDLKPASDGYERPTDMGWQTGIACPDCGKEMVFCRFKGSPGYAGGVNAFCLDDSHPIVQVMPDGTIWRAEGRLEER